MASQIMKIFNIVFVLVVLYAFVASASPVPSGEIEGEAAINPVNREGRQFGIAGANANAFAASNAGGFGYPGGFGGANAIASASAGASGIGGYGGYPYGK